MTMKCELCGGHTVEKLVTKQHRLDGKLYVVENVKAQVCQDCGERYFHATTLDAIDRLLRGAHPVKEKLLVEVVPLGCA
jgi:YgiT-type zinc finger domain-containing protein